MVVLAALILALIATSPAGFGDEPSVFPSGLFPDPRRPVSRFTHDDHMAMDAVEDCYACHHVYEDGRLVQGESSEGTACAECHKPEPPDGSTDLLNAYHKLCKGCHEELRAGPVTCGECHVRD